jgi:hypothetical protein
VILEGNQIDAQTKIDDQRKVGAQSR